jgi:hypothetical protein
MTARGVRERTPHALLLPGPPATRVRGDPLPKDLLQDPALAEVLATLGGASCAAQARLPSGNISSARGLAVTKIAVASGAVSWSYNTSTQTTPGTGTHTVACTVDGVTRYESAPFSVP